MHEFKSHEFRISESNVSSHDLWIVSYKSVVTAMNLFSFDFVNI